MLKIISKSFIISGIVGAMTFSGIAYAVSSITLFVDGKEVHSDVEPQFINGSIMVSARSLAEALGAKVIWDGASNQVSIQSASLDTQVKLLEAALAPYTPEEAVNKYAEGVKKRNGALQFAVMSEELRNKFRETAKSFHWITGTSSPWVADYKIEGSQLNDTEWKYIITYVLTSSTGEKNTYPETVFVRKYGKNWLVAENGPSLANKRIGTYTLKKH